MEMYSGNSTFCMLVFYCRNWSPVRGKKIILAYLRKSVHNPFHFQENSVSIGQAFWNFGWVFVHKFCNTVSFALMLWQVWLAASPGVIPACLYFGHLKWITYAYVIKKMNRSFVVLVIEVQPLYQNIPVQKKINYFILYYYCFYFLFYT